MTDHVLMEDCGNYARITLGRAVLDRASQLALQDLLKQSAGRYAAIVLTGANATFCTGIADEAPADPALARFSRQGQTWVDTVEAIRKHPSVMIAAVNGAALGEGVSLINACDLAIAAEDAQIGLPEIAQARYAETAGPSTQLRILRKHASWMILTGRPVDGRTAARWGLVNVAVPADRVMDEVHAVAESVAKFNPVTVDWSKKAIDDIPSHISDWTAALEYGRVITAVVQNQIGKDKVTPSKF
ncbi:MAG TPA: enoyl-CoA hydratase/isomerase family protein [Burkholderiales bacterium]|nr:enoyl-CoA hydratase/isomerase family protein [Burkholderiales bacterium]